MPRPNYKYSNYAIQSLLKEVETKANIHIQNIADCNMLSAIIAKCGVFISDFTLARLYSVISSSSLPSRYTLDKLSEYVGENSWNTFFNKITDLVDISITSSFHRSEKLDESELTLIKFCLHDNAINPIVNYLTNNLDLFEYPYSDKSFAILNIIDQSLRNDSRIRSKLLPFISANEILRNAYFKYFMNIDGLNIYYANFLETHYLKKLNPKVNNYKHNYIWVNSVLITSYLYSNNKKKIIQTGYELFRKYNPDIECIDNFTINGEINFYPYARFHFSHIVYLFFSEKSKNDKTYERKIKNLCNDISKLDSRRKAVVLSQIFEALFVARLPEIIVSLCDIVTEILADVTKTNNVVHNEEDSIIQMNYYFYLSCKLCNLPLDDNILLQEFFNAPISGNKQYFHTYNFYLNSLLSISEGNPVKKQQYFSKAYKHALQIRNKFFLNQTHL